MSANAVTDNELEQLRLTLLRCVEANMARWGLGSPVLLQMCKANGHRVSTVHELERELDYLVERGLVREVPKVLSPEVRTWRISAAGRDFLAQRHE